MQRQWVRNSVKCGKLAPVVEGEQVKKMEEATAVIGKHRGERTRGTHRHASAEAVDSWPHVSAVYYW